MLKCKLYYDVKFTFAMRASIQKNLSAELMDANAASNGGNFPLLDSYKERKKVVMDVNLQENNAKDMQVRLESEAQKKLDVKTLTLTGVMAALICVLGPLSIPLPVSPVPISLGTLAVYFAMYVLGMKKGVMSCCIYLLLGFAGMPVFTAYTGGIAKVLGPTGGYLIGYIFMAVIGGFFIDKWKGAIAYSLIGIVLGTIVMYAFGTLWLSYQAGMGFGAALAAGVLPFIPGDLAKILVAMIVGKQVRSRLNKAGYL